MRATPSAAVAAVAAAARPAEARCRPTWWPISIEVERDILVRALEQHRFNRTAAGASLGLSLRQMRYRMARLGVMRGRATRRRERERD